MKRQPETGGVSADLSYDAKKFQDGSSMFNLQKGAHGTRVGKRDPQKGETNATFGSSGKSGAPMFGPNGLGAARKKSGADRATGDVRTGQD